MSLSQIASLDMAEYWRCCSNDGLILLDIVHGSIEHGPVVKQFYSTPAVQRLGHLQQLGCCSAAIPGAVHSRLVHSVGTAHLAAEALRHFNATGQRVTPLDVELLSIAGLCHDMGHGPFSHMFESLFLPAVGVTDWHHEDMSAQLLQYTVDTCNIDMDKQQLQFVQDAINGGGSRSTDWRFQIVANSLNSIDVDKIDYLLRDSQMAGVKPVWDFTGLLRRCKVIGQDICYAEQQQEHIAALFEARASMHRTVYQHPLAKAAELMIVDAMRLADTALHISNRIYSPESFLSLTDSVVADIQRQAECRPQDSHLQRAAAVLRRLEQRDFYVWVAEVTVPSQLAGCSSRDESWVTAADVAAHQDQNLGVMLQQDDVRMQNIYIDRCRGAADPLEAVMVYSNSSSNTNGAVSSSGAACNSHSVSAVSTFPASRGIRRPDVFVTQQVRVFLARPCQAAEQQRYIHAVQVAFGRAVQARFGHSIHICSSECSCPRTWWTGTQQHLQSPQQQQHVGNGELPTPQPLMQGRVRGSSASRPSVKRKVFAAAAPAGHTNENTS